MQRKRRKQCWELHHHQQQVRFQSFYFIFLQFSKNFSLIIISFGLSKIRNEFDEQFYVYQYCWITQVNNLWVLILDFGANFITNNRNDSARFWGWFLFEIFSADSIFGRLKRLQSCLSLYIMKFWMRDYSLLAWTMCVAHNVQRHH